MAAYGKDQREAQTVNSGTAETDAWPTEEVDYGLLEKSEKPNLAKVRYQFLLPWGGGCAASG